jgi:hypothetical protein
MSGWRADGIGQVMAEGDLPVLLRAARRMLRGRGARR